MTKECKPNCGNCRYWECLPRFYMNGSDYSHGECRAEVEPVATLHDYWCGRFNSHAAPKSEPPQ